tara:strand:- start:372 stop:500 length:129 start_codon:yes stop_codon:yes gene_type:complete
MADTVEEGPRLNAFEKYVLGYIDNMALLEKALRKKSYMKLWT